MNVSSCSKTKQKEVSWRERRVEERSLGLIMPEGREAAVAYASGQGRVVRMVMAAALALLALMLFSNVMFRDYKVMQ